MFLFGSLNLICVFRMILQKGLDNCGIVPIMHGIHLLCGDSFQEIAKTPVIVFFLSGIKDHKGGIQLPMIQRLRKQTDLLSVIDGHLGIVGIAFAFPDPVVQVACVIKQGALIVDQEC